MSPSIVYILLRYLLVRMKRYVIVDDGSLYKRFYIAGPPKKLNLFVMNSLKDPSTDWAQSMPKDSWLKTICDYFKREWEKEKRRFGRTGEWERERERERESDRDFCSLCKIGETVIGHLYLSLHMCKCFDVEAVNRPFSFRGHTPWQSLFSVWHTRIHIHNINCQQTSESREEKKNILINLCVF